MAKISVVVPIYKVPFEYLDECVESLVNQTMEDIEIVLVDDGSPQEWYDKCEEYAQRDKRIKAVHKQNKGLSEARNYGMTLCTSEWITFVDGDDWIELDFFERFFDYLGQDDSAADVYMYSGFRNYPGAQREGVSPFPRGTVFAEYEDREHLQTKCFTNHIAKDGNIKGITISSGCMKVFRTRFLRENDIRFPVVPYDEDSLFYLETIEKASKVEYVGDSVYHYRFTEGSIVNRYRPNAVHEQELYLNYVFDFIKRNNKSEDFVDKAYMRVMTSMLLLLKNYFFHPENGESFLKRQRACSRLFAEEPYRSALEKLDTSEMRRNAVIKLYLLKMHLYVLAEGGRRIKKKNYSKN